MTAQKNRKRTYELEQHAAEVAATRQRQLLDVAGYPDGYRIELIARSDYPKEEERR